MNYEISENNVKVAENENNRVRCQFNIYLLLYIGLSHAVKLLDIGHSCLKMRIVSRAKVNW